MFRYERPQRGRYRQFIQCGVEAMGRGPASGPESDADVMGAAWAFIRGLEWERHGIVPTVLLNTLGDAESRATYRDELESYLSKHAADLSQLSRDRLARGAVLRVLDSKAPQDQAIAADAPKSTDSLTPVSADRFRRLQDLLLALEIPFQLDSRLVRGLDYYRDTVFEIVAKGLPPHAASSEQGVGQLGTVLAGGRYDDILGTTMPGIGWAAGVDRLAHIQDLLSSQAETTPHEPWAPLPRSGLIDIVPVWQSLPQQPATAQAGLGLAACSLASKIRSGLADRGREDIRVRLRADSRKLRKHLTTSHQAGAHRVVMVSFDQSGNHRVEAKDMHSGQQRELEAGEDIADWLLAN
jgi:histidyl-tRNA synthetase